LSLFDARTPLMCLCFCRRPICGLHADLLPDFARKVCCERCILQRCMSWRGWGLGRARYIARSSLWCEVSALKTFCALSFVYYIDFHSASPLIDSASTQSYRPPFLRPRHPLQALSSVPLNKPSSCRPSSSSCPPRSLRLLRINLPSLNPFT